MARVPRTENNEGLVLPDIPTSICICGSRVWNIQVILNNEYEISWYNVDAECANCGVRATIVTPQDHPSHPKYKAPFDD